MSDKTYRDDLMNAAATRSHIEKTYSREAFTAEVSERMVEAEEVEKLEVLSFEGTGRGNRKLAVHGFDLDDSDNSIALAVLAYDGGTSIPTVSQTETTTRMKALLGFLKEAVAGEFQEGREESSAVFDLAEDLRRRARNVSRYRLYLLTDGVLSGSVKAIPSTAVNGVPTDFYLWDIRRLRQVEESLSGREALEIDLTEWSQAGLAALEVVDSKSSVRTFLAAVPGDMLADLYGKHGSRLLEGNVRSYLSNRGGVNKGIRRTVAAEPANFLAYNNGITATAADVRMVDGMITAITDLQIVNGGQTTASLFYVKREGKGASLKDVTVQMKLIAVEPTVSAEMIPNIARYANSQNKVSEVDFFSNSPFHIRLAELSQRVLAPAQPGVGFQSKWFYERARGTYQNERSKRTGSEIKKFEAEYPRSQVIDKPAAAKYEVTWGMRPHIVSAGAQKNFMAFADLVAKKWETSSEAFNELYWQQLVAKGILFESVRKAIAKADWYEKGYLANYTTYTLAKLAHCVGTQARGGVFNFEAIWDAQAVGDVVINECLNIGQKVQTVLTSSQRPVQNVTEWAKREDCWKAVATVPHTLSPELLGTMGSRTRLAERAKAAAKVQQVDVGIAAQTKVVQTQPSQWLALEKFAREHGLLTLTDQGILGVVTGRRAGFPSEAQSKRLLALLARATELGYDES